MLDALLVADVREDVVEHRYAAVLTGGDEQTGLGHQAQQAHGL